MRDLNDLGLFVSVVSAGGFSAASRATGIPKSRLSRRVAALEAELGVRLVERSSRRFKVTDVGRDVFGHARAAMSEAEAIDEVVSRLKAEPQGLVRLSCPLGMDRLLASALPAFLAANPKLRVQVLVTNRRIDLIEDGVDIAIRVRARLDSDQDLQVRIIGRPETVLVASPAFIAAHGEPKSPEEVARFPTISLVDQPGVDRWELTSATGETAIISHSPRLSASAFPILRQAALDGVGLAFLPEFACRELLATGRLVRVLEAWDRPTGLLHLVFTSKRGLLPSVRAVIELCVSVLSTDGAAWTDAI
ncbi:MAG TPA: LysR substrate-binding domain-containing protein [Caulobacteraceae bacterium]|jgi:DNA-binding transcriptional LysR family regulator|nr:LysR substrate-binding domain-containing protein [Caulobacteraceae bacterium]